MTSILLAYYNGKNPKIQTQIEFIQQSNSRKDAFFFQEENEFVIAETASNVLSTDSGYFGKQLLEEMHRFPNREVKVLVVFDYGVSFSTQNELLHRVGLEYTLKKQYDNFPIALIEVSLDDLYQTKEKLMSISSVNHFYLDSTYKVDYQDTPSSSVLVDEENWWLDAIGATELPFDGSGMRIAILDTGIYSEHVDFASKTTEISHINFASDEGFRNSSDYFDIHGHGTHVAGIAAGNGASSSGKYQGVAPGASLLNVKTLDNNGGITDSDVLDAVDWIITQDNADIISMSFRTKFQEGVYHPISVALESAANHGIIPVAAAGNYGPLHLTGIHPGSTPSVISVGAINRNLKLTSFSSIGPSYMNDVIPDVLAPGHEIIAPESRNSLIGYSRRYTDSQISGSGLNSDYLALSGTSMATPMVSGAIALILEAYPNLTPEGVRAALYQGAYLPDHYVGMYGANGIGAGIINVTASINWLDSLSDPYEIVQAFPDIIPYEPVDLLKYPGDSQIFNISIFSAKNTSKSLDIILPDSQNLNFATNTTSLTYSNHSVQHLQFELKILENATIGMETGSILINDSGTGDLLEQIDYAVNITFPIGRVYFDSLHGLNDLYPEWPSGYSQIEIYDAMKILHNSGYKLVYEMENWTKTTQSQLKSRLLTQDLLSTMDIVVLQTPVLSYTDMELDALKYFLENNGSILLLGTNYETMAVDSLNSLLNHLNTTISINNENILDYTDRGFGYALDKHQVSDLDVDSPVFDNEEQFEFWYGATLEVGLHAESIASLQDKTVVASHESQSGGKVVVWSDFHWMRNDVFTNSNEEDHKKIILNLFEYLNQQATYDYRIVSTFNSTIQTSENLELYLSIVDPISGIPINDKINGVSLNASIIFPLETIISLDLLSNGNGIYYNTSFSLGTSNYLPYKIQINITSPSGLITKEYTLFSINESNLVEFGNSTLTSSEISRAPGSENIIEYTGNSLGMNSTLYGSLTPESIYSEHSIRAYKANMTQAGMQYTHTFSISGNEHSGLFVFFTVASSLNNFTSFEVTRSLFRITNHIPEIDEENSFFNTIPFEDTRTDTLFYFQQVSNLGEIDLSVKVNETISYEDDPEDLYIISYYTAATSVSSSFDILYPNTIPTSILSYNNDLQQFKGQFKIPTRLEFYSVKGSTEVSQQSIVSENGQELRYFSTLWITVRDSDGGVEDYLILLYVNIVFDWVNLLEYLPILLVILAVIAITITVVVVLTKRRQKSMFLAQNSANFVKKIYCMHCGRQIDSSYLVCPYCGKELYQNP